MNANVKVLNNCKKLSLIKMTYIFVRKQNGEFWSNGFWSGLRFDIAAEIHRRSRLKCLGQNATTCVSHRDHQKWNLVVNFVKFNATNVHYWKWFFFARSKYILKCDQNSTNENSLNPCEHPAFIRAKDISIINWITWI